jgi:branched-chain amino acid transport system substrate-binding protein
MKTSSIFLCCCLTVFALFISSFSLAADTIKLGINVPLTGFAATDGKSSLNGAKLATEQINNAGGVLGKKIELVVYDDQASPKQSVPIATKLIEKDQVAVGISLSYSGATRAAAGVYQNAEVPYIAAYAVHPDITKAGPYVFRASFMGEVQGRAGAKLAGDIMGKKKACLIVLNND